MPEKAHQAAIVMGYDAKTWDDDAKIDYDRKPFHETSLDQRRAAMYLGLNPIDKKLDIWWANTDSETKKQAEVIGWDQHKWDDDWNIRDFPIEHLYWKDLDDKQKEAATYFGYTKCTWDESGDDSDLDFNVVSVFCPEFHVEESAVISGLSSRPGGDLNKLYYSVSQLSSSASI